MDIFKFNGMAYKDGQNFVVLLKYDLIDHQRSYLWEKDSAWRIAWYGR